MTSSAPTPDVVGPDIVANLDFLIDGAQRFEGKAELGPIVEDVCLHYRALAICLFADDGNVEDFFQFLLHSPLARRHYLRTVHAAGLGEPRDGRASFVDPVLDAMAARQWKLATDIHALEAQAWIPGEEYLDDYCYGDFLRHAAGGADPAAVLQVWARALEGGPDPRKEVAQALADRDAAAFEDALLSLLRSNASKAAVMAGVDSPSVLAEAPTFEPNRWVSVEGLALIALAEKLGVPVEYEVEHCPRALRTDVYTFRPRGYPNQPLT